MADRHDVQHHDVIVVGAGPSGAAAAFWLARSGWDVALVEKKRFPRAKTCGDGLTPRAVRQLEDMGASAALASAHRYGGMRAVGFGRTLELPWPRHPSFPSVGYVLRRSELDLAVAEAAVTAGATWRQGTSAAPLSDSKGVVAGVLATDVENGLRSELRAEYVVVADGANSRFGRAVGAKRVKAWPLGMALRGYWRSDRSTEPWIESQLELRDPAGRLAPGYGWVFPLGDGRVNVGVGLLASSDAWKGTNTSALLQGFLADAARRWHLDPESPDGDPTGGKLPMGLSVRPVQGARHVLVGDAAGSINPFNGEGIAYGYETGRLAAWAVGEALATRDPTALREYPRRLDRLYGTYYRFGRQFVRLIGHPRALEVAVGTAMRSRPIMGSAVRLMANLMRPEETGPAEGAFRSLAAVSDLVPPEGPPLA